MMNQSNGRADVLPQGNLANRLEAVWQGTEHCLGADLIAPVVIISVTDAFESINLSRRKASGVRSSFPVDEAVSEPFFLGTQQPQQQLDNPTARGSRSINFLKIQFEERMSQA